MKIALAQLNFHIGNFEQNTRKIIETIDSARSQGAELVVFAELAICGYPPRDFLEFEDFIQLCEKSMNEVAAACIDIAAIVGGPSRNPKPEGKDLFNSGWFLADGKVQQVVSKSLLPNYDIFDEYRYFEPSKENWVIDYKGLRIALTICEDLWDLSDNPMYTHKPMDQLVRQGADLMINIAASPFDYDHARARLEVLKSNIEKYELPLIYLNHIGAQTELIFDGGSVALDQMGQVVVQCPYFEESLQFVETADLLNSENPDHHAFVLPEKLPVIRQALVTGIQDYFQKLGFKKAILGMSGGIDSAVTLALAAEALGPENVRAVMLPSQFSSDHSVSDSEAMVANLGCASDIIPIKDLFDAFQRSLAPQFADTAFGLAEENLQARARGVLLMALSNKFGYILLNTSNKSEAAVGYGTLYGDMCGGLSVLGDVYKTEVFALAREINREKEIIPENIITKPPSAELRPDQKDSDSLPEYDDLDPILYQYIEQRKGPQEIIKAGHDETLVRRILRLVNLNEYKRYQTPPILRISPKAFGMGRRMPIVGKYLS